jgi:catechol 2,3-dioxygenase-like lactoylglutathione lyase family enzyme
MRTFLDAKAMAKAARQQLAALDVQLTHSQALELVAKQFGLDNWNVLAAKIETAAPTTGIAFQHTAPIFRIFDAPKAKEFYLDFLGFRLDWEHRFGENFPLYMQVSRAGLILHLSEHHGDASPGSTAFVTMSGVHAYQRELAAKDYTYMKPGIEALDWGNVMTVTDPFSNKIRFSEPVPD